MGCSCSLGRRPVRANRAWQFWLPAGEAGVSAPPYDPTATGTTIYVTQAAAACVE
jgi:hypothetical protein